MPSTRMLADQFSVSRITVLLTYERLIAEGYLTTIPAKGTFVTRTAVAQNVLLPRRSATNLAATNLAATNLAATNPAAVLPLAGRPDSRLFPAGRWRTLIRDALDGFGASLTAEHHEGDPALRRAIAQWLSTSRGLAVDSERIMLASGRQHALHIVAQLLLGPGMRAVIKSPCDPRVEELIASTGATISRLPVDHDGIRSDLLPDGPTALALVTPEHQRPLGAVMSEPRRRALLAWAERHGAVVIADDVDGELRYDAMDSPPLMGLDRASRVIHLGGFGLSLGPAVQLAYLALPLSMVTAARAMDWLIGDHTGHLEAAALANLLETGAYARHLHQLRKVYLGRRDALIRSLQRHFGSETRVDGETGGLHFVWHLPHHVEGAAAVAALARQFGLDAVSLREDAVLMGFGAPDQSHIEQNVSRLAAALTQARPRLTPAVAFDQASLPCQRRSSFAPDQGEKQAAAAKALVAQG